MLTNEFTKASVKKGEVVQIFLSGGQYRDVVDARDLKPFHGSEDLGWDMRIVSGKASECMWGFNQVNSKGVKGSITEIRGFYTSESGLLVIEATNKNDRKNICMFTVQVS